MLSISFLMANLIETGQWQDEKKTDSAIQIDKSFAECPVQSASRVPSHGRGIGNAPVCRHRMARPDGADFLGRVVADGE